MPLGEYAICEMCRKNEWIGVTSTQWRKGTGVTQKEGICATIHPYRFYQLISRIEFRQQLLINLLRILIASDKWLGLVILLLKHL